MSQDQQEHDWNKENQLGDAVNFDKRKLKKIACDRCGSDKSVAVTEGEGSTWKLHFLCACCLRELGKLW